MMTTAPEDQQARFKEGFCKKSGNGASMGECTSNEISKDWFQRVTYMRYIIWFFRDPANKCQWKYHERYSTNDLSTLESKLQETISTLLDISAPCTGHQKSTAAKIKTTAAPTTTTKAATTKTLPADGRCPIVVDVRTQAEWDAGHAPCAHRLEIQYYNDLEKDLLKIAKGDRTHPVQLYCRSGNRAGKSKSILEHKKWTHVTNAGGWESGQIDSIKKLCKCTSSTTVFNPYATTTAKIKTTAVVTTLPADARCPIVVDVRTPAEWDAGHASCAHRLEIQYFPDLEKNLLRIAQGDRTHPVQLYCRSGNRAGKSKSILQDKKWTHVTNAGGWESGQIDSIKKLCECTSSVITLVKSGQACDPSASGYLQSSPGFVDSLAACANSCQASSQCTSITLFGSKWCSHFSSKCTRQVDTTGATTVLFVPGAAEGWAIAGDGQQCDSGAGEVYLKTSHVSVTLEKCLTSCRQSASGCKSITFFQDGWCSHFSSACTKTKAVANAVAFNTITSTSGQSVTTKPVTTLTDKACDYSASGHLPSSSGFVDSLAACTKSCQASSQCTSITFYGSKWCSHFSSKCTRLVDMAGAKTVRFEAGAQAKSWTIAGDGKECDSGSGEVYLKTSPGNGGTLAQCLTKCGQSASCKSITFFQNGWCSHFSSACTKTKAVANAVAFSRG